MKKKSGGMARANNQKSSPKVPMKFATGGVIPRMKDMGSMAGEGMNKSGFGSGKSRGGGKAVKGTDFRGTF